MSETSPTTTDSQDPRVGGMDDDTRAAWEVVAEAAKEARMTDKRCSLCYGSLEGSDLPICLRCQATAKAHARLERHKTEEREWMGGDYGRHGHKEAP